MTKQTSGNLEVHNSSGNLSDYQEDFINYVEQKSDNFEDQNIKKVQLPELRNPAFTLIPNLLQRVSQPKYTIYLE